MLTGADVISLAYTPDLEEAGAAFACRSLAFSFHKLKKSPFTDLRGAAADTAVELAMRRYLFEKKAVYTVRGNQPFSSPGHYDLSLGKHTCRLRNQISAGRPQPAGLEDEPAFVLQFAAEAPLEELVEEGRRGEDLLIFTYTLAEPAADQSTSRQLMQAGRPACLIHPMTDEWTKPRNWLALKNLAMKSEEGQPLEVELGGLNGEREFIMETVELQPKELVPVKGNFYNLAYVRAMNYPQGRVGIQSTTKEQACVIAPAEWGNIGVYGKKILLAGWLSQEEFRRKAGLFTKKTGEKLLKVRAAELNPLKELIEENLAGEMKKADPGS